MQTFTSADGSTRCKVCALHPDMCTCNKRAVDSDEMGMTVPQLLRWMLEVADARNTDPKSRTINLKFTRATLNMWQDRAREALEGRG